MKFWKMAGIFFYFASATLFMYAVVRGIQTHGNMDTFMPAVMVGLLMILIGNLCKLSSIFSRDY